MYTTYITFDFRQFGDWVIYRLINIHVILCNVFHEYIEFQILWTLREGNYVLHVLSICIFLDFESLY